jgi:hypothetical protein
MAGFDPNLDHIVYATPDLEAGIAEMEALLGVTPSAGGQHTGGGTRNALVALGDTCYLEIIGPDPEQPEPERPRPFGIDRLERGRLVTWAVHTSGDLDARVERSRNAGYDPGNVRDMSRATPSGETLAWRLTYGDDREGDGLVPFIIDWGTTRHPAQTSAGGCTLVTLRAEHPSPAMVKSWLEAMQVELEVVDGPRATLIATIDCPGGRVELR